MNDVLIGLKYIKYFYNKVNEKFPLDTIILCILVFLVLSIVINKIREILNNYYQIKNSFSQKVYKVLIPNNKKTDSEKSKTGNCRIIIQSNPNRGLCACIG